MSKGLILPSLPFFFLNVFLYLPSPKDSSRVIYAWSSGPGDPAYAEQITPPAAPSCRNYQPPAAYIPYMWQQRAGWSPG